MATRPCVPHVIVWEPYGRRERTRKHEFPKVGYITDPLTGVMRPESKEDNPYWPYQRDGRCHWCGLTPAEVTLPTN